jgi:hypothetical protein
MFKADLDTNRLIVDFLSPRAFSLILVALTLSTMALQGLWLGVAGSGGASAEVPSYQWKFLSTSEKAAVNAALEVIRHQRIKNVTLNIVDDNGKPYTGPVQITQDLTSFVFMVGDSDWPVKGMESEYIALTPSRSIYFYQPSWRYVQPTETAPIDFSYTKYDVNRAKTLGLTDIHLIVGPDFPPPGDVAAWSETPPDWARSMSYLPFKEHLTTYVEALASHYKGIIGNYHLWDEANARWSNRGWPIEKVVDIIRTEALTIRNIDPDAKIYVDLINVSSNSSGNNWTPDDFIQQLLAASVPFDYIGLEAKYGAGNANSIGGIDTLQSRLRQLAKYGKPVYLWEEGFPSFIEARYRNTQNGWCCYFWHGLPTEEKQAEYMLAEAIVTLADYPAVVAGVRFNWLADQTDNPSFNFRYMGVIYDNRTRKDAFYALRDLWGNLTINTTVHSTSGVVSFSGLAGSYTVAAEGYRPIRISVAEGATGSFNLNLVPLLTPTITATASATITHSTATSTHTEEPSWVMMVVNALLTTPIGKVMLIALALTIAIAAAIVVHPKIKRSLPQRNEDKTHWLAEG